MGYLHIDNLYKNKDILLFKECYALEKIDGTSAHICWNEEKISFFSGGSKLEAFKLLFDEESLVLKFKELFGPRKVVIFGEAYGGKIQGMSKTYGNELKFIVFDVKIDKSWISVPEAEDVAKTLGLEFVDYVLIPTDLESIDKEKEKFSIQAIRNGMGEGRKREGIVLRPLIEVTKNNGSRVISKHKNDEFRERKSVPNVSEDKLQVLSRVNEIVEEWVTFKRLEHVLQKIEHNGDMKYTKEIVLAMVEDVYREGKGEIVESKELSSAISKKTVGLWKLYLKNFS